MGGLPDHDATAAPAALAAASVCVLIRGKHLNPDPRNTSLACAQHLGGLGGQVEYPAGRAGCSQVRDRADGCTEWISWAFACSWREHPTPKATIVRATAPKLQAVGSGKFGGCQDMAPDLLVYGNDGKDSLCPYPGERRSGRPMNHNSASCHRLPVPTNPTKSPHSITEPSGNREPSVQKEGQRGGELAEWFTFPAPRLSD